MRRAFAFGCYELCLGGPDAPWEGIGCVEGNLDPLKRSKFLGKQLNSLIGALMTLGKSVCTSSSGFSTVSILTDLQS